MLKRRSTIRFNHTFLFLFSSVLQVWRDGKQIFNWIKNILEKYTKELFSVEASRKCSHNLQREKKALTIFFTVRWKQKKVIAKIFDSKIMGTLNYSENNSAERNKRRNSIIHRFLKNGRPKREEKEKDERKL